MNKIKSEIFTEDKKQERLLEILKDRQSRLGYLTAESLVEIARSLELPLSEVYGVATFYSFLCTRPVGRNIIWLCKSLPCYIKSNHLIIDSIKDELGIRPGETTADGRFSLELTNCIGACDKAPAMLINHEVHGDLTPERISEILKGYR